MKHEMPSSVRAASATMPARSPLVTHIFVPVDHVLVAVAHRAAREVARVAPGVGFRERQAAAQLAASPAAAASVASAARCRGATIRCAAIVCVLTMPDSDIQPYASSSTTPMYVSRSRPRPPYASGIVMPNSPSAFICSTIASGYASACSSSGATGHHLAGDEAPDGVDQLAADLGIGPSRSCGARYARIRQERRPNGRDAEAGTLAVR